MASRNSGGAQEREIGVIETVPPIGVDGRDDRVDPASGVGTSGRGVGVRRLPERSSGEIDGIVSAHLGAEAHLDDGSGVE